MSPKYIYRFRNSELIKSNLTNGDFFPEGFYRVFESVTDEAGNYYEDWFRLYVRAVPEIITINGCPDDITKEIGTNVDGVEVLWIPPTAVLTTSIINANESFEPNVSTIYMPGDRFFPGVTTIDYEFRSDTICSFNVTVLVVDTEPPVIFGCNISIDFRMPEFENIFYDFDGAAFYFWSRPYAEEKPNKSHEVILVTETRNGDPLFFPGRTTVNYVFRDQSGNTAECNFTVTVPDNEPPRVKCPGDIVQYVPAGVTGKLIRWKEPIVSDYSSRSGEKVVPVSQSHTSGQVFSIGVTVVRYTYADWAGNTAMCEFHVHLLEEPDQEVEMFDCEAGIQVPMWKTCNTVPDCNNGKDELVCGSFDDICPVNSRPCRGPQSVRQCIANTAECDFTQDCTNGTDEMYCDFPDVCGDDYFQCPSSRVCLHRYFRCNGKVDCEDGHDEKNCEDPGTVNSPFVEDWYLRYQLESFPTDIDYKDLALKFNETVYQPHVFHRVKGEIPPDWNSFLSFSSTADFSDLNDVLGLTADEIVRYGHQTEDLILECTYNEQNCSDISQFATIPDDTYGNCFTFNYVGSIGIPIQSTRAGSKHGLKMTLFLEQSEYLSIFGREGGVRVAINPADVAALPADDGITIRPGTITSIGLRYENVSRLGGKYSDCIPDDVVWQDLRHGKVVSVYDEHYDRKRCLRTCVHRNIVQACGCSDTIDLHGPRCRISNTSEDLCRQYIRYLHDNNALGCDCGQPCNTGYFVKTVSQSAWPSNVYLKHLLRNIQSISKKTIDINDAESVKENIARVEIFYEGLNYAITRDVPAYEVESLFSDLGGTVGLYIGFSVITVCEFAAVGIVLVRFCFRKYFLNNDSMDA
ncbi:uncharacterized protein [Amphiura filiformis]|uniref:uncharacterized protein n=1 Tax=Amphiura filiformis TaxID=82378 RepID=UPI003B212C9B